MININKIIGDPYQFCRGTKETVILIGKNWKSEVKFEANLFIKYNFNEYLDYYLYFKEFEPTEKNENLEEGEDNLYIIIALKHLKNKIVQNNILINPEYKLISCDPWNWEYPHQQIINFFGLNKENLKFYEHIKLFDQNINQKRYNELDDRWGRYHIIDPDEGDELHNLKF